MQIKISELIVFVSKALTDIPKGANKILKTHIRELKKAVTASIFMCKLGFFRLILIQMYPQYKYIENTRVDTQIV
jgi:hypothetical protein